MALYNYEEKTGGEALAIPHNGNLSNGIMFPLEAQWNGKELDETYVMQRDKWEPLYEATQIKGDGEAHPFLSPDDEFADYETWAIGNLDVSEAKTDDMDQHNRCLPAGDDLDRPGIRSGAESLLLCARGRDPNAALVDL